MYRFRHIFFAIVALCMFNACSNSEYSEELLNKNAGIDPYQSDYLNPNDEYYPYAGLPRIIIETEYHQTIKDRENEIPARLQVWGKDAPQSEPIDITIRGRGNSSWNEMPKKSYKIELLKKRSLLGMPKDRDWALISNYADKTLMKNYLMYHLSAELGTYYSPRCEFVELYVNREYLGVYLLTETIKISGNRINIPQNDSSFLVEIDWRHYADEQIVYSHVIRQDSSFNGEYWDFHFQIHYPRKASKTSLKTIERHIQFFEKFLATIRDKQDNNVAQWVDVDEYVKHYWIQEFSKNPDADFRTSVYFSWKKNDVIRMGPVWDFDLAFGGYVWAQTNSPLMWHTDSVYWNHFLLQDAVMAKTIQDYWVKNRETFSHVTNVIDSIQQVLQDAATNNFNRWDILMRTEHWFHRRSYNNYKDATDDLKAWINKRIEWIDSEMAGLSNQSDF